MTQHSNNMITFIYGTLKQGGRWNHLLVNSEFVCKASVQGQLWSYGTIPVLTSGNKEIQGEIWDIQGLDEDRVKYLEEGAGYKLTEMRSTSHPDRNFPAWTWEEEVAQCCCDKMKETSWKV